MDGLLLAAALLFLVEAYIRPLPGSLIVDPQWLLVLLGVGGSSAGMLFYSWRYRRTLTWGM